AASLLARAHSEWKEARRSMIASLLGKLIDDVTVDDLPFLTDAQIDSLPEQKRARICAQLVAALDRMDLQNQRIELDAERIDVQGDRQAAETRRLANIVADRERLEASRDVLRRLHQMALDLTAKAREVPERKRDLAAQDETKAMLREIMAGVAQLRTAGPVMPAVAASSSSESHPWDAFTDAFYRDKPGLGDGSLTSYKQAFREFGDLFPGKKLGDITKADIKAYCDHLRDRPISRAGRTAMSRDTIVKLLGHVRSYLDWTVSASHLAVNPAAGVQPRAETREERMSRDKRRAFTDGELTKLFDSPLFVGFKTPSKRSVPGPLRDRDEPFWFFAIAALTGARVEEIANLPAEFVTVGSVECFDFRHAGKTAAGPRLVPVLPVLWRLGLRQWAATRQRRGLGMVQGPNAYDDWSKWTNRYLLNIGLKAPGLVTYSLRHSFRQALRAANLHEELVDKVFGHEGDSVGAGYGRELAAAEANLVIEKVRFPVSLDHLFIHTT
ncbi:hypothetical protein, partial [Nitrospirillum viridazoti]